MTIVGVTIAVIIIAIITIAIIAIAITEFSLKLKFSENPSCDVSIETGEHRE